MINVMRKLMSALAISALLTSAAAAQTLTWRFDTDGDLEGWTPGNFESVEVTGGMLRGVTQFDCQLLSPLLNINAADWTALEFRVSSSLSGGGEIFFAGEDGRLADDRKTRHVINASAEPQVIRVDLSSSEYWTGVISRIRLDLLNPAGAAIALDHISFLRGDPGVAPDPSFEHDFDGDGMPDFWAVSAAISEWSAEHATDGNRALMIGASQDQREAQALARVPLDQLGVFALDATVTHVEGCRAGAIRATLSFFPPLTSRSRFRPLLTRMARCVSPGSSSLRGLRHRPIWPCASPANRRACGSTRCASPMSASCPIPTSGH